MNDHRHLWLPVLLMLALALTRWPGLLPDNFSALYAVAFCAGVYFPRRLAWWLPLVTIAITDLLLNLYYRVTPVTSYTFVCLAVYAAIIWIGRRHSPKLAWIRLLLGGVLGALLFYLVTNTVSWMQDPAYPKTVAGWIQALTTGISGFPPTWSFFRNTLLSGGLFTGLFAGAMKLSEAAESAREKEASDETGEEKAPAPAAEPGESQA